MEVVRVHGRPIKLCAWVIIIDFVIIGTLALLRRPTSDFFIVAAVIFLVSSPFIWLAWWIRGEVAELSPYGIQKARNSLGLIPWTSIIEIQPTYVGSKLTALIFQLDTKHRSQTPSFELPRLKANSLSLPLIFLDVDGSRVLEAARAFRGRALDALTPAERASIPPEPTVDPALERMRVLANRRPTFSLILAAILVFIFFLQIIGSGASENPGWALTPNTLIQQGGIFKALIGPQYWRLVSATFLHTGLVHLIFNILGLVLAGFLLEGMIGWRWCAIAFSASALTGSLISLYFLAPSVVSVGASTGIVGLFAAGLVLAFRYPAGSLRTARIVGAFRILLPTLLPRGGISTSIDFAGHLGGALGGLLVGLIILCLWRRHEDTPNRPVLTMIVVSLLMGSSATSVALAALNNHFMSAFASDLPADFGSRVSMSEELFARFPNDPRVAYARAAALYGEYHHGEARDLLEKLLSDQSHIRLVPETEPPARALLGIIDIQEGRIEAARQDVKPLCGTKDKNIAKLIEDMCR